MKSIRSGAGCNVDVRSSHAETRRGDVGLDIKFLNRIHGGSDAEVLEEGLVVVGAIQSEIVLVRPVPTHRHRGSERGDNEEARSGERCLSCPGDQQGQLRKVAAIERKALNAPLVHNVTHRRISGLQKRNLARHLHGLGDQPQLHRQIHRRRLVDSDVDPWTDQRLETCQLCCYGIAPGQQIGHDEVARPICGNLPRGTGCFVGRNDSCAGKHRSG